MNYSVEVLESDKTKMLEIDGVIYGEYAIEEIEMLFLEFLESKKLWFAGFMIESKNE